MIFQITYLLNKLVIVQTYYKGELNIMEMSTFFILTKFRTKNFNYTIRVWTFNGLCCICICYTYEIWTTIYVAKSGTLNGHDGIFSAMLLNKRYRLMKHANIFMFLLLARAVHVCDSTSEDRQRFLYKPFYDGIAEGII